MNILCRKTEIKKLKVVIIYVVENETMRKWKWKIALSILSIKRACGFWCFKNGMDEKRRVMDVIK